jgi:hypothetical protein
VAAIVVLVLAGVVIVLHLPRSSVQLTSWRPGAGRLAIAVLRPQQSPASLVIGQYAA